MGLFSWGKKTDSSVVWRDASGTIKCAGDSCSKTCDETCPIYLHTMAVTIVQLGEGQKAIPVYEKALQIAPDFYDAWNNLGGIYGQMGNIQKAYDCYIKAREFNKEKANPVYGLMLASRDLNKYDECLEWCDIYQELSDDGREVSIRKEVTKKLSGNQNDENKYQAAVDSIIDENASRYSWTEEFINIDKLCDDVFCYCCEHYSDPRKKKLEPFVSTYYASICLAIYCMRNDKTFSKDEAFQFLQTQCDAEYMDVHSDILLGYERGSEESDIIWNIFDPYLKMMMADMPGETQLTEEEYHKAMKPLVHLGFAVAYTNYDAEEEEDSLFVGEYIEASTLIGRNYYHYTNGVIDEIQPGILEIEDIDVCLSEENDETAEEGGSKSVPLTAYIPRNCWIKRVNVSTDTFDGNRLLVIELDESSHVTKVIEILEELQYEDNGLMIPGMMPNQYYNVERILSDESEKEMELLLSKRLLPQGFTFIGKKLPQDIIDEGGNGGDNTNYTYALRSAYRQAYTHMSIDTEESGVSIGFDYSSYQSTGSGYWDMYTRPQPLDDKHEELVDMLLYIIDRYTKEEYRAIIAK